MTGYTSQQLLRHGINGVLHTHSIIIQPVFKIYKMASVALFYRSCISRLLGKFTEDILCRTNLGKCLHRRSGVSSIAADRVILLKGRHGSIAGVVVDEKPVIRQIYSLYFRYRNSSTATHSLMGTGGLRGRSWCSTILRTGISSTGEKARRQSNIFAGVWFHSKERSRANVV